MDMQACIGAATYIVVVLLLALVGRAEAPPSVGIASFYHDNLTGKIMADGSPYSPKALTCASWHLKLGQRVLVTNISSGKSVVVTCTDRGPHKRLKRLIDLSRAAFEAIGDTKDGLITVQIFRK